MARELRLFSFDDQQRFYRLVADLYPVQQSFDPLLATNAFDAIHGADLNVVELGGWDGKLAQNMLHRTDVATWTNYDLVEVPTACSQPGYQMVVLEDYLWTNPIRGDVFVATHMIEHIRFRELLDLFDALRVSWVTWRRRSPSTARTGTATPAAISSRSAGTR